MAGYIYIYIYIWLCYKYNEQDGQYKRDTISRPRYRKTVSVPCLERPYVQNRPFCPCAQFQLNTFNSFGADALQTDRQTDRHTRTANLILSLPLSWWDKNDYTLWKRDGWHYWDTWPDWEFVWKNWSIITLAERPCYQVIVQKTWMMDRERSEVIGKTVICCVFVGTTEPATRGGAAR